MTIEGYFCRFWSKTHETISTPGRRSRAPSSLALSHPDPADYVARLSMHGHPGGRGKHIKLLKRGRMDVMDYLATGRLVVESVQGEFGRDGYWEGPEEFGLKMERHLKKIDQRIEVVGQLLDHLQPNAIGRLTVRCVQLRGEISPRVTRSCRKKNGGEWYFWPLADSNIHRHLLKTKEFKKNYQQVRNVVSMLTYLLKMRSEHLSVMSNLSRTLRLKKSDDAFVKVDPALDRITRRAASIK